MAQLADGTIVNGDLKVRGDIYYDGDIKYIRMDVMLDVLKFVLIDRGIVTKDEFEEIYNSFVVTDAIEKNGI